MKCKICGTRENLKTQQICWSCDKNQKILKEKNRSDGNKKSNVKKNKTKTNKTTTNKKRTQKITTLKRKADKLFSEYIRKKYSDKNGYCECISCGKRDYRKNMHNAHFIERACYIHRWDENNCRPACPSCNVFRKEFHIREFTTYMIKEFGIEFVEKLNSDRYKTFNLKKSYVQEIIEDLEKKLFIN